MDPGTQLGPYEILEPLGKGGMGEVYRAHDTKLDRDVAVKVLPEELADDEHRLGRLRREARSLAALNHPGIATIHGFEEHDGTRFIVMELVEGDTLAERLHKGALPVDETLELAVQIAKALEAAHEQGIVHRDLKPSNVKITPASEVYVRELLEDGSPGRRWTISTGGGEEPVWSRNGADLYYRKDSRLLAVRVETEPKFSAEAPRVVVEDFPGPSLGGRPDYDVGPDGRFLTTSLVLGSDRQEETPQIAFVVNWFEELKRQVPTGR